MKLSTRVCYQFVRAENGTRTATYQSTITEICEAIRKIFPSEEEQGQGYVLILAEEDPEQDGEFNPSLCPLMTFRSFLATFEVDTHEQDRESN